MQRNGAKDVIEGQKMLDNTWETERHRFERKDCR